MRHAPTLLETDLSSFFYKVCRPHGAFADWIGNFLTLSAEHLRCRKVYFRPSALLSRSLGQSLAQQYASRDGRTDLAKDVPPERSYLSLARGEIRLEERVLRHRDELGILGLCAEKRLADTEEQAFKDTARFLGRMIHRFRVHCELKNGEVWKPGIIGASPTFLRMEDRLEVLAASYAPILIRGEAGTELHAVAYALHCAGPNPGEFRELPCSEVSDPSQFRAFLQDAESRPAGATIFISNINEADLLSQKAINAFLSIHRAKRLTLRVLASSSEELCGLAVRGLFSKSLARTLEFLSVTVPPLRLRGEDMLQWILHFSESVENFSPSKLTPEVLERLTRYEWPGNIDEMERTVTRLSLIGKQGSIDFEDLREWAPELMRDEDFRPRTESSESIASPMDASEGVAEAVAEEVQNEKQDAIVRKMLALELEALEHLHPGLKRALCFMAQNFKTELSLAEIAEKSFLSPSHLAALFKSELDSSSKRLLNKLRIEKAKDLLRENPRLSVTEISMEVGFGDFSHFLKMFKRCVRMSPREFRRSLKT